VGGSDAVRTALTPVYDALGLSFDEATVGSIEDEAGAIAVDRVEEAILARLGERYELTGVEIAPKTLALAKHLESDHTVE
jgi:hypothetical protein